jgi:hypothetical protein
MKKLYLFLIPFLILISYAAHAQLSLNVAVDTVNNANNRAVIKVLAAYLDTRISKKDGRPYWLSSETAGHKIYDHFDPHYLYQMTYEEMVVLGITQPQPQLFKVKVLFSYIGTDKVRTIWSINEFFLKRESNTYKLTNALYYNMKAAHYKTIKSPKITYHFPVGYHYQQAKMDSANNYLKAIERFFKKPIPGQIEYITGSTCENVYGVLGVLFQAGTLSSSTTFCGYFDAENRIIITSGDEYYEHELLRTINLVYPKAPDLLKSGITCLWGGTANKPVIYHLKKLYPYLLLHPEVFNNLDDFYYFDDETNPSFVFQTLVINYVLKQEGKAGLLRLMETLKPNITIPVFLKEHYQITDLRGFFLNEMKYYSTRNRLTFDNLLLIK